MQVFSFDPGGTRTGFAFWTLIDIPSPFSMPERIGTFSKTQLGQFLNDIGSTDGQRLFICEEYRVRNYTHQRGFNHQGSKLETIRRIGAIEFRADQLGIPIVFQQSNVRAIGAGFAGIPHDPSKHDKDDVSAIKHGYFYLIKNNLMRPRSL